MDIQSVFFLFLKENVCSGYPLEAALSNVNDSFTLSRLMKRRKPFCDPARDEYPQLAFLREIYRKRFNIDVELRHYLNAVHIGSHAIVAEVENSVDYESASNISRYIKIYWPGMHVPTRTVLVGYLYMYGYQLYNHN